MKTTIFGMGLAAGLLACGGIASPRPAAAGMVQTRMYGDPPPAATDGRVVTRIVAEETMPAAGLVPFAFSVLPGASLPLDDWSVAGLRINLFAGRHRDLWGIDAGGLGNVLTGDLTGIQGAGIWNRVGAAPAAIQAAGIASLCERDLHGIQTAGVYNWTGGELIGLQTALVNDAGGFSGIQAGLFNFADHGSGVQIGLFNMARALAGLQIGLANINQNSTVPFLPVVNFAF